MKAVNKRIHYHIYPHGLWVFFHTKQKDIEFTLKQWLPEEVHEELGYIRGYERMDATCHTFTSGQSVIIFRDFDLGLVAHESFHAVEALFEIIGIPHTKDTSEAWAYMQQYIVDEITSMFQK